MSPDPRHIVFLKLKEDVDQATIKHLFGQLSALKELVAGVSEYYAGENVSVETDLIRGNHHIFWFDFVDEHVWNTYLLDNKHQAIGAQIVKHTEGGIDGVTVCDIDV